MILFRTVDREFLCKRRKRCTDSAAQIRRLLMCPCRFLVLVELLGERYLYGSFCTEFSFFTSPLLVNMWQYLVGWAHSNFTLSNLHRRSPLILSHPLGLSDSASWFTGTSPAIFSYFVPVPMYKRATPYRSQKHRGIVPAIFCTRSYVSSLPPYFHILISVAL